MRIAGLVTMAIIPLASSLAAQDSTAVATQLEAQYDGFSRAYVALDPDAVARLYTADALYMSPGVDIRRGRAAIRQEFAAFFDGVRSRGDSVRIAFTIVDRRICGAQAAEVGYYALTTTQQSGEVRRSRGKFVVLWVRGADGVWRIRVDTYSDVS